MKYSLRQLWSFTSMFFSTFYILSIPVLSAPLFRPINDSDLSTPPIFATQFHLSNTLLPDNILITDLLSPENAIEIDYIRITKNSTYALADFENFRTQTTQMIQEECLKGIQTISIQHFFKNNFFRIQTSGKQDYLLAFEIQCGKRNTIVFEEATPSGQLLSIWETLWKAQNKLEQSIGLTFWNRTLPIQWPADGDYYSMGKLYLTNGHHWDVVGHELGHAIYDLGKIGQSGGGAHKIDECYSHALALSEGWATYFAGWLYLDLNDPDAKFEYLVPRRAPIQLENIPDDVCKGPKNEWRVAGFLWDLIDTHEDDERSEIPFEEIWKATTLSRAASIIEVSDLLKKHFRYLPEVIQKIKDAEKVIAP